MRSLVRSVETIYWLIGVLIGVLLVAAAPFLAEHWIQPQALTRETVERALVLIAIAVACMWPRALYANGLTGMQRQVALNVLSAIASTLQNVGGVLVVWQAHTIEALIAWYACVGLLDSVATGILLWRTIPASGERAVFDARVLVRIGRFAAGMGTISLLAVLLTQLDKIILSNVLTLETFAYYTLAWRVAGGLYYLTTPITSTFFPRFAQLAVQRDEVELARLYHRSCQLLSVAVLPVAVVIAVHARDFLLLWTHDETVAVNAGLVLTLLMAATALNGLMGLPLMLQLAYGSTRLVVIANAVAVALLAPLIYLGSVRYGGVGAAAVWLVLNCGYVLILLRLMHRKILPHALAKWFAVDVGAPLAAALGVALLWRFVSGGGGSYSMMFTNLAISAVLSVTAAALAAPQMRGIVVERLLRSHRRHA
jgi:O-antigen/teichoic acid export membrane protein